MGREVVLSGSAGKEPTCNAGDLGSIPGWGRSHGDGNGYPLQYSGLENSMDFVSPWGHKESDMTERLSLSHKYILLLSLERKAQGKFPAWVLKVQQCWQR